MARRVALFPTVPKKMIAFPFIYFVALSLYWWKKHQGLDLCVYMSALYAFTALMGIIAVAADMVGDGGILCDSGDVSISFIPTLVYCLCITACLLPFSMFYKKDLRLIRATNPKIVYLFSWFLIFLSWLNLFLVADSTLDILSGDLSLIRNEHYSGLESPAQLKAQTMPFIFGFLYYFNSATILAIPLFFYYICYEQRKWWFSLLLFFASLSMPIAGIQTVDRTEIIFYAMMFISCLIVFHQFLSKTVKWTMRIISIPLAVLALVYVVAVSDARFSDDHEGGAQTGAIQYAGQNVLNFNYFWENANWDKLAPEREFPMLYHYVYHIDNNDARRGERSGQQGFFMSVFASFAGDIMLDLSPLGMFIWVIMFFLISVLVLQYPRREEMSVGDYLMFFALSVIPIFGIFYYRYMSFVHTFMWIVLIALYITEKYDIQIGSTVEKESEDDE